MPILNYNVNRLFKPKKFVDAQHFEISCFDKFCKKNGSFAHDGSRGVRISVKMGIFGKMLDSIRQGPVRSNFF